MSTSSVPINRKNIVMASEFGYHVDVYMALVWTLERVTNKPIPVYADQPFHHGFTDLVNNLNIHQGSFRNRSQLPSDLEKDNTIDMIVFGTCEIEYVFMRRVMQARCVEMRCLQHAFRPLG